MKRLLLHLLCALPALDYAPTGRGPLTYSGLQMNEEISPQKAHKAQKKPTILPFVPCVLFVVKFLHMWPGHSNAKRCKHGRINFEAQSHFHLPFSVCYLSFRKKAGLTMANDK
jgi:hypothetical protein